jgi:hypothetical protein
MSNEPAFITPRKQSEAFVGIGAAEPTSARLPVVRFAWIDETSFRLAEEFAEVEKVFLAGTALGERDGLPFWMNSWGDKGKEVGGQRSEVRGRRTAQAEQREGP